MIDTIKKLQEKLSPCKKCPYKLGLVQTLVNPCPQCKRTGYKAFEKIKKERK